MKRLVFVATLGAGLIMGFEAHGQEAEAVGDFYAFDPTTRQQAAIQAGLTNAQIYGAVAAVERGLMPHGYFDRSRASNEFNWIREITQVPGCVGEYCAGYKLQSIDLSAGNVALSYCDTNDTEADTRYCAFYAGAVTSTIAAKEGKRFSDNAISAVAGRAVGLLAPLMLLGGGVSLREGMNATYVSAILGVNVSSPYISGRVGYLGAPGHRGIYTDLSSDDLRTFVTAAVPTGFSDLWVLAGGIRQLPLGVEELGRLSTFVRSVRQVPIQQLSDDYEIPDPSDQVGAYQRVTAHLNPKSLLGFLNIDGAYMIRPTPQLYNLIAGLDFQLLRIGGGIVRPPAVPSLGIEEKNHVHFHFGGGFREGELATEVRIFVNDPEILQSFPMARDSWGAYYLFSIGLGEDDG